MRILLTIIMLLSASSISSLEAQDRSLKRDAESFALAIVQEDFDQMLKYSHENILALGGGVFYVKEEYRKDAELRQEQMIKLLSVECLFNNKKVLANSELQTIVDLEYIISFKGRKYKTYSALFASSKDRGANWQFVDLEKHNVESLKEFIPNYSEELKYPVLKEAILLDEK